MNAQRITIGLIFFLLVAACLVQTTMSGCSKNEEGSDSPGWDDSSDAVFVDGSGNRASDATVWKPVGDAVMSQLDALYDSTGLTLVSVERDQKTTRSMRCVLDVREGLSEHKQLLDGLWVFYNTFPNQESYLVELTSGDSVQTGWSSLVRMSEMGFSFEMPESDINDVWLAVASGGGPAAEKSSGSMGLDTN